MTALSYFHHGNDYWRDLTGDLICPVGADIWDTERPAHNLRPLANKIDLNNESAYEERFFLDRMLGVLDNYTPSKAAPMFLFYAAHLVHEPLQVPTFFPAPHHLFCSLPRHFPAIGCCARPLRLGSSCGIY